MTLFNGGQRVPEESLRKSGTSPWTLVQSVKRAVKFCWKCESCKDSLQHIWERSEDLPCVLRNPSTAEHLQRWCSLFGSKNISGTAAWQALLWKMTHIDLYRTERKNIINSQMCKSSRWIDLLFLHMNINYFFCWIQCAWQFRFSKWHKISFLSLLYAVLRTSDFCVVTMWKSAKLSFK